jgi:hypothetical protein
MGCHRRRFRPRQDDPRRAGGEQFGVDEGFGERRFGGQEQARPARQKRLIFAAL